MNKELERLFKQYRKEIEAIVAEEVVGAAEKALDEYIARLDPNNPFYSYDDVFVAKIKAVLHGDAIILDNRESKIACGQLKKQLWIWLGLDPNLQPVE